jgi:hypothetical protein
MVLDRLSRTVDRDDDLAGVLGDASAGGERFG